MTRRSFGLLAAGLIVGFLIGAFGFRLPLRFQPAPNENPAQRIFPPFEVYLAGCVKKPGTVQIDFNRPTTVTQMVLQNGGFDDFADRRRVKLVRENADGIWVCIPVDFKTVQAGKSRDPIVAPDDIIEVPSRVAEF